MRPGFRTTKGMAMRYAVTLTPDDNDTFLATCDALPEVTTFGNTEAEALARAQDAVEEALAARMAAFQPLPGPSEPQSGASAVRVRLPMILKMRLHAALAASGKSRADLVRAMGVPRTTLDRLFDPAYAGKAEQFDAAFTALGCDADIVLRQASRIDDP